ncbi:MAG: HDOD domain-containing protein [Planctomycetes bacterium]|nr:HDOD domain-containing protein [Planctomycetota bacterium]
MNPTPEDRREYILDRITGIHDIPTLPHVINKLNALLKAPHSTAQDVGELINTDQALASKTLKLVNSPYYGFGGKIQNINRAIVILGFNKIRNLALSVSVVEMFKGARSSRFDFPAFWEHSIGSAVMCETLADFLKSPETEDAFVAGLLHDLGKLILVIYFPEDEEATARVVEEEGLFTFDAEKRLLGIEHGELGMALAETWNFPDKLVRAIGYHNRPARSRQVRELTFLVHMAQFLSQCLLVGAAGEVAVPPVSPEVWQHFEFTPEDLDETFARFTTNLKRAADFFNLLS